MPREADAKAEADAVRVNHHHNDNQDSPSQPPDSTSHAPTNHHSPSLRPSEGRQASRRMSLEVVAEAQSDVDGFVKELDQTRRQLDDQIHKFIAQKERVHALRARVAHTLSRPTRALHTDLWESLAHYPPADQPSGASDTKRDAQGTNDKSHECGNELLSLFTPVYLPLLESRPLGPSRSPSAPALSDTDDSSTIVDDRQALQRANTDPAGDNKSLSYRRGLGSRAPSSGSDQGRSLVSALRSRSDGPRLSNQKRISLIAGDEVVVPSDNIFSSIARDSNHRPDDESGARHIEVQTPAHHPHYDQHPEAWSRHNDKMASYNGLTGDFYGYFNYRPVARPGADWHYGEGVDWAGKVIAKVSGKSIEGSMQETIWKLPGMLNITFHPESKSSA
ncbi:hypothetical protein KCU95_g11696, partial [Aureobasidium melanogenum]